MSIKNLRKALEKVQKDEFPSGTVTRWTSAVRYSYAALKADNGVWYTTARGGNPFVPKEPNFEELVEVLSRSGVTDVMVSASWETV